MHTVEKFLKCSVIAIISLFICLSSTICYSAWPLFEMPTAESKADRCYIYSSDQTLSRYYNYIYDDRGNIVTRVLYYLPGLDGDWFTEDDVPMYSIRKKVYNASDQITMEIKYSGPGPDDIPLNDDDIISGVKKNFYDSNGDVYRIVDYNDPGSDGDWFSPDDVVEDYKDCIYDYGSYSILRTDYMGPGNDGDWFTTDDQIEEYYKVYFHSNYRPYLSEEFNGSGMDGDWYTTDDVKKEQGEYFYDANWNLTKYIETKTDGDINETTFQYDGNNNCTRFIIKKNDIVTSYTDCEYDDQNRMQKFYQYNNPGDDGDWFTSDDTWTSKFVFEFDLICSHTILPTHQNFNSSGGSITVNIDANSSSCSWNASESLSWITLSTSGGTGDGSVTVNIAPNSSISSRSGTVTIAGESFSVSQGGTTSKGVFINGGFETGDLSGWNTSASSFEGISVVSNYNNAVSVNPFEGDYFALIDMTAYDALAGDYESFITQDLTLNEGDEISGYAAFYNFEQNDTEYCYIKIYNSDLSYNNTVWSRIIGVFPWSQWNWTAPASGTYTVKFGVYSGTANSVAMFDMNLPTNPDRVYQIPAINLLLLSD